MDTVLVTTDLPAEDEACLHARPSLVQESRGAVPAKATLTLPT